MTLQDRIIRLSLVIMLCICLILITLFAHLFDRSELQIRELESANTVYLEALRLSDTHILALEEGIEQFKAAVESRDEIIAWCEAQPPEIETVFEVKEVIVEVEVEVPVIEYRQVLVPLREWESVEEFVDMFRGGITPLRANVCIPVAENIQSMCQKQGYLVSIGFALNGYYYGNYVTVQPRGHAGIVINVEEDWYFIDPNDWRVTKLW